MNWPHNQLLQIQGLLNTTEKNIEEKLHQKVASIHSQRKEMDKEVVPRDIILTWRERASTARTPSALILGIL